MATDDERREVARRLRELSDDSTYPDLIGAIADHDGWYAATDAADRLADLIDPDCEDGRYGGVCTARPVDRDALLALADEIERTADFDTGIDPRVLLSFARRIREACGEEVRNG